ncbi:homeobox protein Hox-A4-like [Pipra filicauda]|uniref:Homeobox protein Hox-A4-like n=1 Tax=Pipra filicauda TaxID=649802 RepID=A0A6J2H3A5_9PASS|nr:homeobox protein Hox-A4-like [Pipra filicauda]
MARRHWCSEGRRPRALSAASGRGRWGRCRPRSPHPSRESPHRCRESPRRSRLVSGPGPLLPAPRTARSDPRGGPDPRPDRPRAPQGPSHPAASPASHRTPAPQRPPGVPPHPRAPKGPLGSHRTPGPHSPGQHLWDCTTSLRFCSSHSTPEILLIPQHPGVALTSECLHSHPVGSDASVHTETPVYRVVEEKKEHLLLSGWTVGGRTWLRGVQTIKDTCETAGIPKVEGLHNSSDLQTVAVEAASSEELFSHSFLHWSCWTCGSTAVLQWFLFFQLLTLRKSLSA